MAEINSTATLASTDANNNDLAFENREAILTASSIEGNKTDRERIALEATWEIESLSKELVERGKNINTEIVDTFKEGYIIKNLAKRICELNSIVMSALGDDLVSVESLKLKLG